MAVHPEIYHLPQTRFVPNNKLPVLIYRNVLPQPHTELSAQDMLEKNHWTKKGTWGAVPRHHFHPNTHECYAVFQGHSTLLIGRGPLDNDEEPSVLTELKPGDVIILPAGVAHCSIDNDTDYRYIGLYPEGSPKYKNEYCKDMDRVTELTEEVSKVQIPISDPVIGKDGPLMQIWGAI